jgi:mono/diheme cytochrome c family protein
MLTARKPWVTFSIKAPLARWRGGEEMIALRAGLLLLTLTWSGAAFAQSAEEGAQLYEEHCAICHGERLRPTGAAPDLKKLTADRKEFFEKTVNDGRGQMPSWNGMITDEQRAAIWAYIRSRAG